MLVTAAALGCDRKQQAAPGRPEPPASASADPATTDAAASQAPGDAGARDAGARQLTVAERRIVVSELTAGRRLAQQGEWRDALSRYDRALAVDPEDARVLAEAGWAAFNAGDSARARDANHRALRATTDPELRAQVLYNGGRVAEAGGDREEAKRRYADSLVLRRNDVVAARLTGLGGDADAGATPGSSATLPCAIAHGSIEALCKCLLAQRDLLMTTSPDAPLVCVERPEGPRPPPPFTLLRWGGQDGYAAESVHLLVVGDHDGFRPVAELGRAYEPGALGIHNDLRVVGFEVRQIAGRRVLTADAEQTHVDTNIGGLEVYADSERGRTFCAVGQGGEPTRCVVRLPLAIQRSYGLGFDGEIEGPELEEIADRIRAGAYSTNATLSADLGDDGAVVVKRTGGDATLIGPAVLGTHRMW